MLEQFTHNILEGIPILRTVTNGFIGASLSEPHIDELNVCNLSLFLSLSLSLSLYIYIYIYILWYVRHPRATIIIIIIIDETHH